jgi:Protein of unknown function (DUF2795)
MDRGSSKHSSRLDEEMDEEVLGITEGSGAGGRVEQWRESEPSGDDEPDVSLVPDLDAGEDGGSPSGMSPEDRERRSQLGRYLRRSAFPADRAALIAEARANNAPDNVVDALGGLSASTEFANVADVWAAIVGTPESGLEERF